jgi:TRAP-type mannitol/chloroaromatic compound transport system permease small subunit
MLNNQSQSAKPNEYTMDIKHASACIVQNFFFLPFCYFLLFLSFEQVDIEIK